MGLLSGVTDAIGITDSGGGAEVAREAGNFSREATNKAKESYWDNYNDSKQLLDDGRIASLRALQNGKNGAQTALLLGNTRAENELGENYGLARQQLQPLADLGMGAMERLNYGSTAEGFASNVNNLLDGGALAPLIAENQRNLEAELAAQGLTRSGAGIRDLSQLPIETIMGIEGMLQGRNSEVASYGLPAVTNQAQLYTQEGDALASLWSNGGINAANIESGYGQGSAGLYSDYFNTRAPMPCPVMLAKPLRSEAFA